MGEIMKKLLLALLFITFLSTAFSCPTNIADGGRRENGGTSGGGGGSGGGSAETQAE